MTYLPMRKQVSNPPDPVEIAERKAVQELSAEEEGDFAWEGRPLPRGATQGPGRPDAPKG